MVWATPSARVSLWQGLAQVANRLQVSHSGPEGTFTVAPAELSLVPYVFDTMPLTNVSCRPRYPDIHWQRLDVVVLCRMPTCSKAPDENVAPKA